MDLRSFIRTAADIEEAKALLLTTNVRDDDEYLIRYGVPNATSDFAFPWRFDNSIYLSEKLLRNALEKAGFTRIVDLEIFLPANVRQAETRGSDDYSNEGGHRQRLSGRALLCRIDGPATGPQRSLRRAGRRVESNRILAGLAACFRGWPGGRSETRSAVTGTSPA